MTTLSTEELQKQLESGEAAVFDVRGDLEFELGHIPGSKTAPLGSLTFRVARIMNPDSFVAVYSAGGDCRLVTEAARRLDDLGSIRQQTTKGRGSACSAWQNARG